MHTTWCGQPLAVNLGRERVPQRPQRRNKLIFDPRLGVKGVSGVYDPNEMLEYRTIVLPRDARQRLHRDLIHGVL